MNLAACFLLSLGLLLSAAPGRAEDPAGEINRMLRLPIPDSMTLCGEPVPLEREDVRERLDLELIVTLGGQVRTSLWFKRIPRYFPMIEQAIRERGLPDDLKYVALIESNLRADAQSYAGAVGPWQFIRSTGAQCGLEQDSWRDQRRGWEESTAAALDHLAALRDSLGSWPLAMAAYNAGRQRVTGAMESQGQGEFYGLSLPLETERYVFRVMAAKLVVEDPQAYGIDLEGAALYAPEQTAKVQVQVDRRSLPLAAVAASAGTTFRYLTELNPWVRGSDLPRGTHQLLVPAAAVEGFAPTLARWEADNPEPTKVFYEVRRGDTLGGIANRHNVSLGQLLSWNDLTRRSIIQPGQALVVQTVD